MEELLHPRHPLEEHHQAQRALLAALPQEQRAEHARLLLNQALLTDRIVAAKVGNYPLYN